MHLKKLARPARLLAAAIVGLLTIAVVAQATITITVPNAATFTYVLGAGGITGAFVVPQTFAPVFIMGTQNELGFRGVGQVTLLRVPGSFLEWVGLESTSGAAITQGFSAAVGTHIVFLDFSHQVDIEVATPDAIRVRNSSGGLRSGVIRLIW